MSEKNIRKVKVLLLNPPFFRFCGSHNNKIPLSLCYLSGFLQEAGINNTVFNADFTDASSYWSWRWLFEHFDNFKDAVDGKGSLYDEVIEQILSFAPDAVIIMAGEPLFCTTDLGNPFIAEHFSVRLRALGIFTVGMGPFYTLQPEKFIKSFDCIIQGEPSPIINNIIFKRKRGILKSSGLPPDAMPLLSNLHPSKQNSGIAITSLGCKSSCSFCLASRITKKIKFLEATSVAMDISRRKEKSLYLADLDFPHSEDRLEELLENFRKKRINKNFTIEARADSITTRKIVLLKKLGVTTVKIGIEGLTERILKKYNKKLSVEQILQAITLCKDNGFKVVGYLMLGGPSKMNEDFKRTYNIVKKLELDYVIINIWAYDLNSDYRYDTHFSPVALKRWGVPEKLFFRYLELQDTLKSPLGKIINSS